MTTWDNEKNTATDIEVLIAEATALYPDEIERLRDIASIQGGDGSRRDIERERLIRLREFMHARKGEDAPAALCLSGGGIRSATFSLGVVQGLAARGLLPKFHYLSSVSGGGYLASWLSAWIRNEGVRRQREADEADPSTGASGASDRTAVSIGLAAYNGARSHVFEQLGQVGEGQSEEPLPLRKLRAFSSYLSPIRGLSSDALTLLACYARNLTLNWIVLIPALVAVLLLPRLHMAVLHGGPPNHACTALLAVLSLVLVTWTIAYMASDLPAAPEGDGPIGARLKAQSPLRPRDVLLPLVLPLTVAAILVTWLVAWRITDPTPWPWLDGLLTRPFEKSAGSAPGHDEWSRLDGLLLSGTVGTFVHVVGSVFGGICLRRLRGTESGSRPANLSALFAVTITGALTGMGLYLTVHGLRMMSIGVEHTDLRLLGLLGVPLLLLLFWLGMTLYAGWRRPLGHEDEREWWARAGARWLAVSLLWMAFFGLVLYVPGALLSWNVLKGGKEPAALGIGTGALGVLVAVIGYLSTHGPAWRHRVETFAEKVGMRLLDVVGILFIVLFLSGLSFAVTLVMRVDPDQRTHQDADLDEKIARPAAAVAACAARKKQEADTCGAPPTCTGRDCVHWTTLSIRRYERSLTTQTATGPLSIGFGALLGLSLLFSHRLGVNAFSLHSLYGNRLVRAYLAASRFYEERRPHWFTGFDPKDNVPMNELWPRHEDAPAGPPRPAPPAPLRIEPPPRLLHVVNIALNLVLPSGKRLEWQDRRAAPFTVSPLFSGSALTGYVRSRDYIAGPHRKGISLGAAMTISGAAASPNMGYHSSLPLAFVMTLFNVRLGMWLPNPQWPELSGEYNKWPWRHDEPTLGLSALLNEALGRTSEDSRFLNLSDGGHFDNMGLYEMVRRRCRRIVLVDAVADPDYAYDDLLSTVRKIRVDMGIVIDFPDGLPGPKDKHRTDRAVACGRIVYGAADRGAKDGVIVLIKPHLAPDPAEVSGRDDRIKLLLPRGVEAASRSRSDADLRLPLDVRRYAEESARGKHRFPQQPTSDQFFDEAQFESYRMLGLHIARTAFEEGNLDPPKPPPLPVSPPPSGPSSAASAAAGRSPEKGASDGDSSPPQVPPEAKGAVATLPAIGLLDRVRDSAGMVAATAVVSAITVTGAVTLTDATVRISNPEVRLAGEPSPGPAPAPASGPDAEPSKPTAPSVDVSALQKSVEDAAAEVHRLSSATAQLVGEADKAASAVTAVGERASEAAGEVQKFREQLKGGIGGRTPPIIVQLDPSIINKLDSKLNVTVINSQRSAEQAASAAKDSETAANLMRDVARYLADIRDRLAVTPPRSNARGGGQGNP